MKLVARILFPPIAAAAMMFTLLAAMMIAAPALADTPPGTDPAIITGPCSDDGCIGNDDYCGQMDDEAYCPYKVGCPSCAVTNNACACSSSNGGG